MLFPPVAPFGNEVGISSLLSTGVSAGEFSGVGVGVSGVGVGIGVASGVGTGAGVSGVGVGIGVGVGLGAGEGLVGGVHTHADGFLSHRPPPSTFCCE